MCHVGCGDCIIQAGINISGRLWWMHHAGCYEIIMQAVMSSSGRLWWMHHAGYDIFIYFASINLFRWSSESSFLIILQDFLINTDSRLLVDINEHNLNSSSNDMIQILISTIWAKIFSLNSKRFKKVHFAQTVMFFSL
jgi:hypothetical protein